MSQTLDNLSYTWNNAGTTFTGIKYNVTDTASNAASLLMDLQVGGASKVKVKKDGGLYFGEYSGIRGTSNNMYFDYTPGNPGLIRNIYNLIVASQGTYSFSSSSPANTTTDLSLCRDAANTLAQRNSTNAQTFRLYSTYTDSSNYTRLKIGFASGNCEIKPENAGTGGAALLHISGLPTSNPGPGILWNDAGTVKVGT